MPPLYTWVPPGAGSVLDYGGDVILKGETVLLSEAEAASIRAAWAGAEVDVLPLYVPPAPIVAPPSVAGAAGSVPASPAAPASEPPAAEEPPEPVAVEVPPALEPEPVVEDSPAAVPPKAHEPEAQKPRKRPGPKPGAKRHHR